MKHPMINLSIPFRSVTIFPFSMVLIRSFRIGFFLIDKVKVSKVDDGVEKISSDEDRVHLRSFLQFHSEYDGSSSISQQEDRRRHATSDSR